MPRLRRVACMCSSTLSVNCEQVTKNTEEKILCRSLFSQRSHIGNLRQIRKQGKGRSSKRKGNRRLSFLFAHRRGYGVVPAAGRGTFPPSADGESPAEVQRKTSRPLGANTLTQFAHPGFPVQKRSRPSGANTLTQFAYPGFPVQRKEAPVRANPPAAVRVPRTIGAEKEPPVRANTLTQFEHPAGSVQKKFLENFQKS